MMGKRKSLAVAALLLGLLLPSQLLAAWTAVTRADLNLRAGPDTGYGVIEVIPYGYEVTVFGCLGQFQWCDVEWDGIRGWVYSSYLAQPGTTIYLPQWGPSVGVPIVSFSFSTYHDRYYRDRPWYRKRDWAGHWRERRREAVRDRRQDRREAGRDYRQDRREDVRDRRQDVREGVRDRRKERREDVRDRRQERRKGSAVEQRQQRRVEQRQERRVEQRQERRREAVRERRQAEPRQERRRAIQRSQRGGNEPRRRAPDTPRSENWGQ